MDQIDIKDEVKEFIPKPIQVKFATLYMQIPRKTQAEIASELKVHRNTVANWLHDEHFRGWLNSKCNEMIEKSLVQLYQIGLVQALRGKFDFWKVIMELAGVYQPGMKIDTGQMELVRIEVVQNQAQKQGSGDKVIEGNSIKSPELPVNTAKMIK